MNPERIIETLNEYGRLLGATRRSLEAEKLFARAQMLADQQQQAQGKK